jgi:hypothetical protein
MDLLTPFEVGGAGVGGAGVGGGAAEGGGVEEGGGAGGTGLPGALELVAAPVDGDAAESLEVDSQPIRVSDNINGTETYRSNPLSDEGPKDAPTPSPRPRSLIKSSTPLCTVRKDSQHRRVRRVNDGFQYDQLCSIGDRSRQNTIFYGERRIQGEQGKKNLHIFVTKSRVLNASYGVCVMICI